MLNGDVAEVIVYNRTLTPSERMRVEQYLAKKYNRVLPQSDFRYTGHYYHEKSGLSLAPYRAYDAELGRWLSRDPLRNAEMRQGPNLYSYVGNDPVNFYDPLGLWTFGWGVQASGGFSWGGSVSAGYIVGHASGAGWFSGWSAGLQFTVGTGFYAGAGGSVGVYASETNADCVDQLKGLGTAAGFSVGDGGSVGLEKTNGINTNMSPEGALLGAEWGPSGYDFNVGVGAGAPLPGELHTFGTWTSGPTISQ